MCVCVCVCVCVCMEFSCQFLVSKHDPEREHLDILRNLLCKLDHHVDCVYCCSCLMCVVILCVFVVLCGRCCFYLNVGLLARSQYPEVPATGHLDTGFSWFPCVYKQGFQVATTCFSCSPPNLNLVVTNFMFCIHVK